MCACPRIGIDAGRIVKLAPHVVRREGADEYTGPAARESIESLSRVFQSFPRHLEQQPLLRIHLDGLARRNSEELGVELVDRSQEGAFSRRNLSSSVWIW